MPTTSSDYCSVPFQAGFSVACSEARGAVTSTVLTGEGAANYQASLRASLQQKGFWLRVEGLWFNMAPCKALGLQKGHMYGY